VGERAIGGKYPAQVGTSGEVFGNSRRQFKQLWQLFLQDWRFIFRHCPSLLAGYRLPKGEEMPPFLEPDFEQAEAIAFDAGQRGSFTPQQSEWIEAFYKNVEDRMLNLYGGCLAKSVADK
jgi:hypothetical protein